MKAFLPIFFVVFFGCNLFEQRSAVKFNNAIVGAQINMVREMTDLNSYFPTRDTGRMSLQLVIWERTIDSGITILENLKDLKGGNEFKIAAYRLFKFYKRTATNEIHQKIKIFKKPVIDDDDLQILESARERLTLEETPLNEEFVEAQKEFAKKYNLK